MRMFVLISRFQKPLDEVNRSFALHIWKEEPGPQRQNQETQFLKNLSLIGGLLMILIEKES